MSFFFYCRFMVNLCKFADALPVQTWPIVSVALRQEESRNVLIEILCSAQYDKIPVFVPKTMYSARVAAYFRIRMQS